MILYEKWKFFNKFNKELAWNVGSAAMLIIAYCVNDSMFGWLDDSGA